MKLKPIRNRREHKEALAEVERLWDAPKRSPDGDRLEMLVMLIERYESEHFPMGESDPIDLLLFVMEQRGLTRNDLEPYIGPRGRVADILNRTRPLTNEMIRRLADGLKLPAEVLIKPYPLRDKARELAAA